MNRYEDALKILAALRSANVNGLGVAIDTLERLSASHADDTTLQL